MMRPLTKPMSPPANVHPPEPLLSDLDLYLFGEGRHERIYEKLGAHVLEGEGGVRFAVWAPNARAVSVVGDFNGWDPGAHPMQMLGSSGVWATVVPRARDGHRYKLFLRTRDGAESWRADPYARATEAPPLTASIVERSKHTWSDDAWMKARTSEGVYDRPFSIYEAHLGSWRRAGEHGERPLSYREIAPLLADYVSEMGFTHVELMPVMEHPFGGSWGYQVTGYYAPTARFGGPDDFRHLIDVLHARGIGVILDWVPAHFPKDDFALGRFDGSALYEHLDPRQGEHPDWGTYVFNYARNEVRNFLIGNALYWLREFHVDGLRVDAVASMLYLDYSREGGGWVPNAHGGRENLEAIAFLKELNEVVHREVPGVRMIAEESTAWPAVSAPTYDGGLGFGFKWNMGWMNDTLRYFARDPIHRSHHQDDLTFGLLYAFSEKFILPISHDEVVHGKGSLYAKMPGDDWQKRANVRALLALMFAHPGAKLLFMGIELGGHGEWHHDRSLDWHLLAYPEHAGTQRIVAALNRLYRDEPALWRHDREPSSFEWIDAADRAGSVLSFLRRDRSSGRELVCMCNLAPVVRHDYRIGVPEVGVYEEIFNSDATIFGGSGVHNEGTLVAAPIPTHGREASLALTLPPLAVIWLRRTSGIDPSPRGALR